MRALSRPGAPYRWRPTPRMVIDRGFIFWVESLFILGETVWLESNGIGIYDWVVSCKPMATLIGGRIPQ